jgi:hypothetical protein
MAISYDNVLTKHYHGRFGNAVLRWCRGKSIMSKLPDCSKVVRSKAQRANEKRFAAAVHYAKMVLKDPKLMEDYDKIKKEYQSTWNAAISNFLLKPKIDAIDLDGYQGQPGNTITVSAQDKYKVEGVNVMILNETGQVVESGPAVERPFSGSMEWDYKVTVMNPSYKGNRVVVRVSDLPGNVVQESVVLDST